MAIDSNAIGNKFYSKKMATVSHYTPAPRSNLICCKGNQHEQQSLNLVCLDPLCRDSPLSCCVCFTQVHKYHKVVGLSKLLDDYKRNVGNSNVKMLHGKINKHYAQLKVQIEEFKDHLVRQVENFEKAIDKYTQHLFGQSYIRSCVGQQLKIELEPDKISQLKSQADLEKSLRFILNNSLYDDNLNMINASEVLKQNEDRVCALLDKMVYMTSFCEASINDALSSLKFANQTLNDEKTEMNKKIDQLMKLNKDVASVKSFMNQKSDLTKLIEHTGCLVLQELQKVQHMDFSYDPVQSKSQLAFGKYRFKSLQLSNEGRCIRSSIHNEKPQYALAWPNINLEPLNVKQWSMKIKKCRDFTTENTMAVGISKFSDMRLANYKGSPTNCLLVSSEGYVTLNNKTEKTKFTFQQGDILHFRYDPFYDTFQVGKQNGRKLTLRGLGANEPVYACVRFTYASDQVQIL